MEQLRTLGLLAACVLGERLPGKTGNCLVLLACFVMEHLENADLKSSLHASERCMRQASKLVLCAFLTVFHAQQEFF